MYFSLGMNMNYSFIYEVHCNYIIMVAASKAQSSPSTAKLSSYIDSPTRFTPLCLEKHYLVIPLSSAVLLSPQKGERWANASRNSSHGDAHHPRSNIISHFVRPIRKPCVVTVASSPNLIPCGPPQAPSTVYISLCCSSEALLCCGCHQESCCCPQG